MQYKISKNKTFFFLFLLLFQPEIQSSDIDDFEINSYGISGYINTPSSDTMEENSLILNLFTSYPVNRLSLTATPFNWLEASIFYTSITDKPYVAYGGDGYVFENQSYKDKGFNVKFLIKEEGSFPSIAIGLNDFAGTGLSDSEYIVATKNLTKKIKYSFGIGWGNYSNGIKVSNPFSKISENFQERPQDYEVGNINPNRYFSGDSSLFGAIKYNIKENLDIYLEYDPTVTDGEIELPDPKYDFNIGIKSQTKRFNFNLGFIRGKELSFQTTYKFNTKTYKQKRSFKKTERGNLNEYEYLQKNLEENNIGLISIAEEKKTTEILIKQNAYNSSDAVEYIVESYALIEPKHSSKDLYITQQSLGMINTRNIISSNTPYNPNDLKTYDNDLITKTDYIVLENYPIISSQFNFLPRLMLGAREGFFFGGIMLEHNLETIFKENIILLSNAKYSILDNFSELYIPPVDTFPAQVRSDNKDYLKKLNDGITIGRLELNYFESFKEKHFYRLSLGLFEEMFGGAGIEYIYYPYNSNFSFGFESFKIKKRDYDMRFNFQDYENSFQRISGQFTESNIGLDFKLSYGEYLAGDVGYTLELSRRFRNGIEFGFFFSRTDVSKEDYGEGSFDKGINLKIPFNFFGGKTSLQNWQWKPLTKDPASQLIKSINLRDHIHGKRTN